MRALVITQNITLDGSIEMLDDWFDAQGQGDRENADLMAEMDRLDAESDALVWAVTRSRTCAATGRRSTTTRPASRTR